MTFSFNISQMFKCIVSWAPRQELRMKWQVSDKGPVRIAHIFYGGKQMTNKIR